MYERGFVAGDEAGAPGRLTDLIDDLGPIDDRWVGRSRIGCRSRSVSMMGGARASLRGSVPSTATTPQHQHNHRKPNIPSHGIIPLAVTILGARARLAFTTQRASRAPAASAGPQPVGRLVESREQQPRDGFAGSPGSPMIVRRESWRQSTATRLGDVQVLDSTGLGPIGVGMRVEGEMGPGVELEQLGVGNAGCGASAVVWPDVGVRAAMND